MYFLLFPVLLACLSFAQGFHLPPIAINMQYKLGNYLTEWSQSLDGNNIRSPECLASFLERINALSEEFETSYASCLQTANNERAAVEESVQEQRTQLTADAAITCSLYSDCNEQTTAVEFFDCYSESSNKAAKLNNNIGADANTVVQLINFSNEKILYEQTSCTSTASQVYSRGFNQANSDLNDCLAGKPPQTTSTSTLPTTEKPTSQTTEQSTPPSPSPSPTTEQPTSPSPSPSPTTEQPTSPSPSPTTEQPPSPSPSPTTEQSTSPTPSPSPTTEQTTSPSTVSTERSPEEDLD